MSKKKLLKMMVEVDEISSKHSLEYCLAYGSLLGAVRDKGFIKWDNEIDISVDQKYYDEFISSLKSNLSESFQIIDETCDEYELPFARVIESGSNHHSLHIDIFPLIGTPNNVFLRRMFVEICYIVNKIDYIKRIDSVALYKDRGRLKRYYQSVIMKVLLFIIPLWFISYVQSLLKLGFTVDNSEKVYTFGGSYKMREVFNSEVYSRYIKSQFENSEFYIPEKYDEYLTQVYGDYMTPRKKDYLS